MRERSLIMKTSAYCFIMTTIVILISGFAAATQPNFEASYRLLLDGTGFYSGYDMSIGSAAMSDDGSTIIAYTYYYYGSERDLFIIDTSSGVRSWQPREIG